jgi:uncharacterized protein YuzE
MKIVYDPEKDILQIAFRDRGVAETAQIAPDLILDYDEDGQVIGVEIRSASQRIDTPNKLTYTEGRANLEKPQPYTGTSP